MTYVFRFDNVDPRRWLYNLKEPGGFPTDTV